MTAQTVRVETELVGYDAGTYVTVDDSVPLIAALIARGYLTIATPPAGSTATGPGPLSAVTLGDLTSPSSAAGAALRVAYALPVAATVTAAGTLVVQKHNPVDATSGALPMTLPTGASAGSLVAVEKVDPTTNAVTVTGSIRGGASSIALVWAHETLLLSADASGSWWPVSGHKTKTSLDAAYEAKGRAIAYTLALGGI